MTPDENLIAAAIEETRPNSRARDAINTLADQYRTACDLSRGPDRARCKHWQERAAELSIELRKRANLGASAGDSSASGKSLTEPCNRIDCSGPGDSSGPCGRRRK